MNVNASELIAACERVKLYGDLTEPDSILVLPGFTTGGPEKDKQVIQSMVANGVSVYCLEGMSGLREEVVD